MVMVKGKGRPRSLPLVLFDRLTKDNTLPDGTTVWKGEKGVYVFSDTGEVAVGKPIRKVYLNRTYLTGLFKGKRDREFSGDMKTESGKKYLVFRQVAGGLEIYQRG